MTKQICLILTSVFFIGCATKSIQMEGAPGDSVSQWESKTHVFDKAKSKGQSVTVGFVADKRNRLRMDVVGTFSTPVAAAVVADGKMTYILPQQKKFYQGAADQASMKQLLKVDIGVDDLFAILYDEPLKGWVCRKNSQNQVESCGRANGGISLVSADREGSSRKVKISTANFEINMNLERVATTAKDLEKVFTLKIPESYKSENYAPKQL